MPDRCPGDARGPETGPRGDLHDPDNRRSDGTGITGITHDDQIMITQRSPRRSTGITGHHLGHHADLGKYDMGITGHHPRASRSPQSRPRGHWGALRRRGGPGARAGRRAESGPGAGAEQNKITNTRTTPRRVERPRLACAAQRRARAPRAGCDPLGRPRGRWRPAIAVSGVLPRARAAPTGGPVHHDRVGPAVLPRPTRSWSPVIMPRPAGAPVRARARSQARNRRRARTRRTEINTGEGSWPRGWRWPRSGPSVEWLPRADPVAAGPASTPSLPDDSPVSTRGSGRGVPACGRGVSRGMGTAPPAGMAVGTRVDTHRGSAVMGMGDRRNSRGYTRHNSSSASRGYGYAHRKLRAWWVPRVATGLVKCWRCMEYINGDESWHLGHQDGNNKVYKGPEHVLCNVSTNERKRKKEPRPTVDRFWEGD